MPEPNPIIDAYNQGGDNFSSLWLKYVRAVDLSQHCIGSLIGERHEAIDRYAKAQVIFLNEHPPAPVYYLCGVTYPYVWSRNVHLMAIPAPGEQHEFKSSGFTFELYDLRPVEITRGAIDPAYPKAKLKEFFTCRNWQGAWWMHVELGLRDEVNPETAKWRKWKRKDTGQRSLGLA